MLDASSKWSKRWNTRLITVAEAEAQHTPHETDLERIKKFPLLTKPFGFLNPQWESLKSKMLPGDELREFSSPHEDWQNLSGLEFIALIRGGETIDSIITGIN